MAKVIFLGTANAVPDEKHENTHILVVADQRAILIDSVGNDLVRLQQVGVDFNQLTDLILTHFHPDHVSGVAPLLMTMWLLGRKRPLTLHGLGYTLERMEKLMEFYDWLSWPNFFPLHFHPLPEVESALLMEDQDFRIVASPVRHLVPTIGVRIDFHESGSSLAYSCDTEPCPAVARLAAHATVLIHEASGASLGHTSAGQAGQIAQEAGVKALYLVHYPTRGVTPQSLLDEASRFFTGQVVLAQDFMSFEL